jgi:hypothetical protein
MAGEEFAAKVLVKALGLTQEDTGALRDVIAKLKEQGPELMENLPEIVERAERSEAAIKNIEPRVQALCFYFKNMDPVKWAEAEAQSIAYFKKKEEKIASTAPKEG